MENASEQEMAAYLQTLERINELEAMTARIQVDGPHSNMFDELKRLVA